jgi:hypothetical protein
VTAHPVRAAAVAQPAQQRRYEFAPALLTN